MFVSMNAVKNVSLKPPNAHAQHMKQPPFRSKKCWSNSILRERNYAQQTKAYKLILIALRRTMHLIYIRTYYVPKTLQKLLSKMIV